MKPKVILCGDGGENSVLLLPFFEKYNLGKDFEIETVSEVSLLSDLPHNEDCILFLNSAGFSTESITGLVQNLLQKNPCLKIIIYEIDLEILDLKKLFEKGIKAYLGENFLEKELEEALMTVNSGKIYITDEIKNRLVHFVCEVEDAEIRVHQLNIEITRREREVLRLVCEGFRTKKIADQLGISPHTVECHRRNIMHKFKIRNAAKLVKFAKENHLVEN